MLAGIPKVHSRRIIVKSQTFINLLKTALVLAVIAALLMVLWTSAHAPVLPATVSWNGTINY